MTTSPELFLTEAIDLDKEEISPSVIAYFRERLRNRLHQLAMQRFRVLEDSCRFTKAQLARRIGREPAQVNRWLGASGNWTLDTASDLLLGMGCELSCDVAVLQNLLYASPTGQEQGVHTSPTSVLATLSGQREQKAPSQEQR
jgi:hypothetical protein